MPKPFAAPPPMRKTPWSDRPGGMSEGLSQRPPALCPGGNFSVKLFQKNRSRRFSGGANIFLSLWSNHEPDTGPA